MITEGTITLRVRYHGEADRLADIADDVQAEYNRNVEYEDDGETPLPGFVAIATTDATDTIHVDLIWDFGMQTEDDLTKDQLWDLIQRGRVNEYASRVTSLVIWTTDALACVTCDHSTEQHDADADYCLNPGCDCQAYAPPQLAAEVR